MFRKKSIKILNCENGECVKKININYKSVKCLCELDNGYLLSEFDNPEMIIFKNDKKEGSLSEHKNQVIH